MALEIRQVAVKANDIVYDTVSGRLYVSVPGNATAYPNSIAVIDPETGAVETSVWVGSEPNKLALSGDGQYLYVGLDGAASIRRVHLPTLTAGLQFSIPGGVLSGSNRAVAIAVLPGSPQSVAVVRGPIGNIATNGVAIYDDGVQRPVTTSAIYGPSALAFGADASQLYGFNTATTGAEFFRMQVTASGVSVTDTTAGLIEEFAKRIDYVDGHIVSSAGDVFDPGSLRRLGRFRTQGDYSPADIAIDAASRVAFGLDQASNVANGATAVWAFGLDSFTLNWALPVPGAAPPVNGLDRLVRWPGGVALRSNTSQVFVLDLRASAVLSLSKSGTGRGDAKATALSMTCGVDCSRLLPETTTVTVTAVPKSGSAFVGWEGDDDCSDGVVTMAGARSCVAVFRSLTSGPETTVSVPTNDLVYSELTGKLYASVPGTDSVRGNSVTEIDPSTGEIGASVWVGSEPGRLAVSDDGATLYVALNGAGAIRRVDLVTLRALGQFGVGPAAWAEDLAVLPGDSDSVAVVRRDEWGSIDFGTAVYTNGVMRPVTTPGFYSARSLAFSASSSRLYGYDNYTSGFELIRMNVGPGGVTTADKTQGLVAGYDTMIHYAGGRVFADSGQVVDPEALSLLGTFPMADLVWSRFVAPDLAFDVVYAVGETSSGVVARRYDPSSFTLRDSVTLPGSYDVIGSLSVAGSNRVAFRAGSVWNAEFVVLFSFDGPASHTISIASVNPATGVTIDVSPADVSDAGQGSTPFERTFATGTSVTLTAPAVAGGKVFSQWQRNGESLSLNPSVKVTIGYDAIFTAVYWMPAPSVTAVSPASGPMSGGTPIVITGSAFVSGATVSVGGKAATAVSVVDSTTITALTPSNPTGVVTVRVTNPDLQTGSLPSAFTYLATPGQFAKVLPVDKATGSSGVASLAWAATSAALRYEYCVDATVNGSCDGTWVSTGTAVRALAGALTALTTYEWQVRAVNAAGTTEASGGWWRFTIAADSGCVPGTSTVLAKPSGAGVEGMWQSTGVSAVAGRTLSLLVATGQTWTKNAVAWTADGDPANVTIGPNSPLPGAARLSLVGRIGLSGTPFLVGRGYQAPAAVSGQLFLAPNDDWYMTWGNAGSLPVTVCPGEMPCSVDATATVPPTAEPGVSVALASTATATSCAGAATFDWDFGDGSPHGTAQNPTHTYATAGSFTWVLTARAGSASATRTGTILVQVPGAATCTSVTIGAVPPPRPGVGGVEAMWQSTGITLTAGELVTVTATGTWSNGGRSATADGDATQPLTGANCPLSGQPTLALVGRIGATGAPFLVGASKTWTPAAGGVLYLAPNDNWYATWDNGGSLSVSVCVGGAGSCSYTLTPASSGVVVAAGASGSFAVAAGGGCAWTPVSDAAWLHVTAGSGPGNGTVSYAVDANPGGVRAATITVAGQVFAVSQAAAPGGTTCTAATVMAVPPPRPGVGGVEAMWQSTGITLTAGQPVTVSATGTWSNGGRASTADGDATQTLTGANCPLSGQPTLALVGRIGPTGTPFLVGASKTWTPAASGVLYLAPNDNWYTLWDNAGSLAISVCVGGGGGCSYTLTPGSSGVVGFNGASDSFAVTADGGCAWTPVSDAAWLHVTAGSGPGSGTVSYTVDANPGGTRTATITVADQVFAVSQAAAPGGTTCTAVTVAALSPAQPGVGVVEALWQSSGITLTAGQPVTVSATGTWSNAGRAVTADGDATQTLTGANCPLSGQRLLALVGRIGPTGAPFLMGASKTWTPATGGVLYLAPNDNWYTIWDNAGTVTVTVCR